MLNLEKGEIVHEFKFELLKAKNYQKKVLSGEGHFLIPYKDNTTLEVYQYGEGQPLFRKTYANRILSVLVEKQRFVVFSKESGGNFFCQINHLKTGLEIANIPLIGMKVARATISDQILFINYPIEGDDKFSYRFYFINLANGKILKEKFFKKSHKVSRVSFNDGLLTYRTHMEEELPEWFFHDFKV